MAWVSVSGPSVAPTSSLVVGRATDDADVTIALEHREHHIGCLSNAPIES